MIFKFQKAQAAFLREAFHIDPLADMDDDAQLQLEDALSDYLQMYREMAAAHINFNSNGHATVKKLIDAHKNSEEYKRNPAYADGMIAAWTVIHDDLIARTAEVKAMIDGFK